MTRLRSVSVRLLFGQNASTVEVIPHGVIVLRIDRLGGRRVMPGHRSEYLARCGQGPTLNPSSFAGVLQIKSYD
jgi:hypothetical protein